MNDSTRSEFSRRSFLIASASGAGALALAGCSVLGGERSTGPAGLNSGAAARTEPLDVGWLFAHGTSPISATGSRTFDRMNLVDLPHCVTPLSWRNWNPSSWEQDWTYAKHFRLPSTFHNLRVFVDFDAAMVVASPSINGHRLPPHSGGYLPFSYELTDYVNTNENVLVVNLDSRWSYVPPEGAPSGPSSIDYLEPGGLYRNVSLRAVPQVFISDVFAKPINVLSPKPSLSVTGTIDASVVPHAAIRVKASLYDKRGNVATSSAPVSIDHAGTTSFSIEFDSLRQIRLWSVDSPALYTLVVTVFTGKEPLHSFQRTIGFRDAKFELDGFFLNGERLKIFGLNRHQIYPYAGMAMPRRVQRRDAEILRHELNCNMVRCSHYPQSSAFLDACDELGLLVWEETPGWSFLGDQAWKELVVRDVFDMVVRDRSRPSVVIWGVQVNESAPDPGLYTKTKSVADTLDGSRPTSGAMDIYSTKEWVQDVFAFDDYTSYKGNATLLPPLAGVPYLVTEAVGTLDGYPYYRHNDPQSVQQDQARQHAQVHEIAASNNRYCGVLGWCAFDYDSLNGNIYENLKWPGVADTFRILKPGAAIYQSQVDPTTRPVIQPAFYWDFSPPSPVTSLGKTALIFSNCDRIVASLGAKRYATLLPDKSSYSHLRYPPFLFDVSSVDPTDLPELRLDGYVGSKVALTRHFSADHRYDHLLVSSDDSSIYADGSDATRVSFQAVDRYDAPRPYVGGLVKISSTGPGVLVGERVFEFGENGGAGAVWIRSLPKRSGTVHVLVEHDVLGNGTATIHTL